MIFIAGFHHKDIVENEHAGYCSSCGMERHMTTVRRKPVLSLFFIPITVGKDKIVDICSTCGKSQPAMYANQPNA